MVTPLFLYLDYHCSPLWKRGNDVFFFPNEEIDPADLGLSEGVQRRLHKLVSLHDDLLDKWIEQRITQVPFVTDVRAHMELEGIELWLAIRDELGTDYVVYYVPISFPRRIFDSPRALFHMLRLGNNQWIDTIGTQNRSFFSDEVQNISKLSEKGVVYSREELVRVEELNSGKIVYIEWGNDFAGLLHVLEQHGDFAAYGLLSTDDIVNAIIAAVLKGKVVGTIGRGEACPVYMLEQHNETYHLAIDINENGFLVGAWPAGGISLKDNRELKRTVTMKLDYHSWPFWSGYGPSLRNIDPGELFHDRAVVNKLLQWCDKYNRTLDTIYPPKSIAQVKAIIPDLEKEGYELWLNIRELIGSNYVLGYEPIPRSGISHDSPQILAMHFQDKNRFGYF